MIYPVRSLISLADPKKAHSVSISPAQDELSTWVLSPGTHVFTNMKWTLILSMYQYSDDYHDNIIKEPCKLKTSMYLQVTSEGHLPI